MTNTHPVNISQSLRQIARAEITVFFRKIDDTSIFNYYLITILTAKIVPANTGHSSNAVSMLAQRLRRWPNIETALYECPVYAGALLLGCLLSTLPNINITDCDCSI